jgi:methionyl-tRNA synthetase
MAKFYITNAIPYVNGKPHIGHALEFTQSDTIARYHRILGDDVLLLCGGDENALKKRASSRSRQYPYTTIY